MSLQYFLTPFLVTISVVALSALTGAIWYIATNPFKSFFGSYDEDDE